MSPIVGIFVGGRGLRMGGVAKGLLRHQGRTLLERLLEVCQIGAEPGAPPRMYLVGNATAYDAALPRLADDPAGVGPIGGLRALLIEAGRCDRDAVALAVDQPYASAALIRRLYHEQPGRAALAPREEDRWQPLFARYRPRLARPALEAALAAGQHSLQAIFERLSHTPEPAAELVVSSEERLSLRDWDRPSDMDGTVPDEGP